jgi:hypothetical protein
MTSKVDFFRTIDEFARVPLVHCSDIAHPPREPVGEVR